MVYLSEKVYVSKRIRERESVCVCGSESKKVYEQEREREREEVRVSERNTQIIDSVNEMEGENEGRLRDGTFHNSRDMVYHYRVNEQCNI